MNKDKFSWFLNKFFFIHPIAITLIFIINSYEIVRFNESFSRMGLVTSIALTLFFLLLSYLIFKRLQNNSYKAAILTSSFIFFILFFFDIHSFIYSNEVIKNILNIVFFNKRALTLLVFFSGFFLLLTVFIKKDKYNSLKFTWFLNVITIIFLTIKIAEFIQANSTHITLADKEILINSSSPKITPNIYYIILDSYTGNQSLKQYWNFDNSELTGFLKNNGFYIAKSNSNYNWTPFSLSSSLNMSYLNIDQKANICNEHFRDLINLINNNRISDFLRKNNYEILNYSFFEVSNKSKYFKNYFFLNGNFFGQSIFSLIWSKIPEAERANEINNLPNNNLDVINQLKLFFPDNKHYFIYAHILLPHYPYFFDHNGNRIPIRYANDPENKNKYLEQLKFTNKLIIDCIKNILSHSQYKPVIIIQGDHGFRYLKSRGQLAESFTILNAYYFPDKTYSTLYDSISPVNSFRVVLNKYFNTKLPLLKDSSINVLPKEVISEH